jgi:hypothetical protein
MEEETQDERAERYFSTARAYSSKDKDKTPSNKLTAQIIRWVEQRGGFARRVNTQGQYDVASGKWRPSGMKKGFEDIDVIMPINISNIRIGIKIAVEVKIGKDVLSIDQKKRREEIESCGGIYIVAKGIDQTTEEIMNKMKLASKGGSDSSQLSLSILT